MPKYNGATFKETPNYWRGRQSHAVRAVVLHVTQGPIGNEYNATISWFENPASQVSAHFLTSPTGNITQFVDTFDSAWANGATYYASQSTFPKGWTWQGAGWYCAHKHKIAPTWQLVEPGVNPNLSTISVENAGQSGKPISAAQMGALVGLLRWLGAVHPALLPYVPGKTLIGHNAIDNVDKAFCPGSAFNLDTIATLANAPATAKYVFIYPQVALTSNDMRAALAAPPEAPHLYQAGDVIEVDDITGNMCHDRTGLGFVPLPVLRKL
jgi:N-acetyl-anhydromuramyl-L-alanine amidase AmpD